MVSAEANGGAARQGGHSQTAVRIRLSSYQRPRVGSRHIARPTNRVGDILFVDPEFGKAGADFVGAAALQRAQHDALPVRAYLEVVHIGEPGDDALGSVIWFLTVFFANTTRVIQENKECLLSELALGSGLPLVYHAY